MAIFMAGIFGKVVRSGLELGISTRHEICTCSGMDHNTRVEVEGPGGAARAALPRRPVPKTSNLVFSQMITARVSGGSDSFHHLEH